MKPASAIGQLPPVHRTPAGVFICAGRSTACFFGGVKSQRMRPTVRSAKPVPFCSRYPSPNRVGPFVEDEANIDVTVGAMIVTAATAGRVHRRNGRRGLERCTRKRTTGCWGLVMVRSSRLQLACLLLPLLFATPCWSQSGSANEWHRKIVEQLRAHLRIPPDVSAKASEVWVDVTIDRAGFVKSTKLVRGTSVPALDAAVLAAIKDAQPFPLPPAGAQLSPLPPVADDGSLTLPLAFFDLSSTKTLNDEQLKARLKGICRGC